MAALPKTMRALLLNGEGFATEPSGTALEALEPYVTPGDIEVPDPGLSQVLIKVSLASINPSDVMFVKGMYGQPRVKGQPAGFEGVGEVVATGDEAGGLAGRRVAFTSGLSNWGSWADYAVAEASACIPLIDGVSDEDGAAMIVNPITALAMLDIVREAGAKSFVLTAAASQLCKLMMGVARDEGLRPIAIVRRDDQRDLLEAAGAAVVLNGASASFDEEARDAMRAEKPLILLDAATGPAASTAFHHMGRGARWIVYGRMDREPTVLREPGQLIFQNKRIEGFWLVNWMRAVPAERRAAAITEAQRRFRDGRWSTDVTAVVPLSEAMRTVPQALSQPNGKVFIKP